MNNKLIKYFKESAIEMRKVVWPSRRETTNHTLLVIGISLGIAAFIAVADYFLTLGLELIIK